jgi:hypothetical protein
MTTDIFDFAAATKPDSEITAHHPSTMDVLQKGNYVVTISELQNTESSGGYPMLKLTLDNEQGRQWDNLVISPNEFSVARLLGLVDSAGLSRPDASAGEIDPATGKLDDRYVDKLLGRKVGVIVRDEEDNRPDHFGEVRPRVKGYVAPDVLTDATTGPLGGSTAQSNPPVVGQGQSPYASDLAF